MSRSSCRLIVVLLSCHAVGCGDDLLAPNDPARQRVHAGNDFSCALDTEGRGWCWGFNNIGQLGNASGEILHSAPSPIAGDMRFRSLGIHGLGRHACAVSTAGAAFCWGENDFGQLGNGATEPSGVPVAVAGGLRFTQISAGWRFTCGVTEDHDAYCWGRGLWGQLGDGQTSQSSTPVRVLGEVAFESIQAGTNNLACGLAHDGSVYCWGLNWRGEVGSSTNEFCGPDTVRLECASSPVQVTTGGGALFRDVAAGNSYACGVLVDGAMYCWGRNTEGQLGSGSSDDCPGAAIPEPCTRVPARVPGEHRFVTVTAGNNHTCGTTESGAAVCWGRNRFGELGDGSIGTTANPPTIVRGGLTFVSVSAGASHTCGAVASGTLYCWGINDFGQLGDGTGHIGLTPVAVSDPL